MTSRRLVSIKGRIYRGVDRPLASASYHLKDDEGVVLGAVWSDSRPVKSRRWDFLPSTIGRARGLKPTHAATLARLKLLLGMTP